MAENYRITIAEYIHKSMRKWLTCQEQRSAVSLFNCLTTLNEFCFSVHQLKEKNSKTVTSEKKVTY